MQRFFYSKSSTSNVLPPGTKVFITGGTYKGHNAEIIAVTDKMYHIKLDNHTVTKVKHTNAQVIEENRQAKPSERQRRSPTTTQTNVAQPSLSPFEVDAHLLNSTHRYSREQCEAKIAEAANEIHRQAEIISEFTERLRMMNLEHDD